MASLTVDARLAAWGRRAAAMHAVPPDGRLPQDHGAPRRYDDRPLPTLWLFTDAVRLPDPRPAARRLPCGRAGIVLRHDDTPGRAALGRDLARICRVRRLVLVVAGDLRLAATLRAGVHLRAGSWPGPLRPRGPVTSSAHNAADLHRAHRAGADLAFLSPVFPTASHPGAPALGPANWARIVRQAGLPVAALGGIDGRTVRRLPIRLCAGVGAIGALV
ncbi:MAG: thiamine phosphate synthase [Acetobacteraceae bacterium]|nr:thiamine phosphate synthase [Acetobacteraceae bacterium]